VIFYEKRFNRCEWHRHFALIPVTGWLGEEKVTVWLEYIMRRYVHVVGEAYKIELKRAHERVVE